MKTRKGNENPREYGAPEMKKNYLKNFRRGLEYAIVVHIAVISVYLLINYLNNLNADDNKKPYFSTTYIPIDIPPSVDNNNNDIPKTQDIVKPTKDLKALTPVPVTREKAEEMTIKTQKQLDIITGQISHEGDSVKYIASIEGNNLIDKPGNTDNTIKIKKPPVDEIYKPTEVQVIPECVNFEIVKGSIKYPQIAIETGQEGTVSVKVLVGTDGKVIRIDKMSGPEVFYDEVREKAMNLVFTVGLQNGKPVKVWMTVPFKFELKN